MDTNYLIEILLTAKDEASGKLRALKQEINELKAQAAGEDMSRGLGDMANEADRAAQAHKELSRQQQESRRAAQQSESDIKRVAQWQEQASESTTGHAASTEELNRQLQLLPQDAVKAEAAVKRVAQHHDDATEAVSGHAAAHEDLGTGLANSSKGLDDLGDKARNVKKALAEASTETDGESEALGRLQKRTDEALSRFDELSAAFRDGSADSKQLRQDLQASGRELGVLSGRFKTASDEARLLRDVAEEAAAMSKNLSTLDSKSRQPISNALGLDKAKQDLASFSREFETFRGRVAQAQTEQQQAEGRITARLFASRFGSVARQLPTGSGEFDSAIQQQLAARTLSTVTKAPKADRDFVSEGDVLIAKMRTLDQAARTHTASNAELHAGYSSLAGGLRRVWREMEVGSSTARRFGDAMDEAGKKSKNLDLARADSGLARLASQFNQATDSIGIKIISISAALRGARLVGLVGLFQPLATGLVSLAGGFFSVASGAAQAAATIGGVFLSGLGQLIPMVSIGIASLIRLRDVFQAVQAAQAAKQEAFFQPNQGLITQLQNTNQLIQSEHNLANAYYTLQDAQVQVRQTQIALTQARIDAIRNLQDLVLAEKDAKLQLEGSNLSMVQAQEQLRVAEASGQQQQIQQAQLAVQEAALSQQHAQLQVPRSAQNLQIALSYGVTGSPGVLGATEAARQAKLGVIQAQQSIADAQRQMQITKLTLAQPASHMTQQQATLKYLLGQMSAPEKALFSVINGIENQLRSPNSPLKKISDQLIGPFLYAFQRLDQVLSDPKFMAPITKLAHAMGKGLQEIFKTMFGGRGTSFFETMAKDAAAFVPVVTRAITGLMKVFEDIATAAAPAFKRLSTDWANFWNAMDRRDRSPQGQARLEAFFNKGAIWAEDFAHLAGAIFGLFKALGHDAAPQGMKSVTSFTEAIRDATGWVKTHGPEVTKFFDEARQGLSLIGGTLFTILKTIFQVFDLTSLKAFAGVLQTVVLPAAKDVALAIGFLVTKFMQLIKFLGAPGRIAIEGIVAAFMGLLVINRVIGLVSRATTVIGGFHDAYKALSTTNGSWLDKLGAAWKALTDRIGNGRKAMQEAKTAQDELNTSEKTGGGAASGDAAAQAKVNAAEATGAGAGSKDAIAQSEVDAAEATGVGAGGADAAVQAEVATAEAGGGGAAVAGGAAAGGGAMAGIRTALATAGTIAARLGPLVASSAVAGRLTKLITGTSGLRSTLPGVLGSAENTALGFVGLSGTDPGAPGRKAQDFLNQTYSLRQDPSQLAGLNSGQLDTLRKGAQAFAALPDITARQRNGLAQLIKELDPARIKTQQLQTQWSQTFAAINTTTGNVMTQVAQQLSTDIQNISANLGSGTKEGAQALVASIASAWQTVLDNTSAAVRGTAKGVKQINDMLNQALGKMGQAPLSLAQTKFYSTVQPDVITGLLNGSLTSGGVASPNALGGWHKARPGGSVIRTGEDNYDEVTLTTDPRHASRQRGLLDQYLMRAPHMATGGYVYPIGPGLSMGRTDMGQDWTGAGPIATIGSAAFTRVAPQGSNTGWPGAGGNSTGAMLVYQLLSGIDAGRYVYLAENVDPIAGLTAGSHLGAGQVYAHARGSYPFLETGWAANSMGATASQVSGSAFANSSHSNTPEGQNFAAFISGLARGKLTGGGSLLQQIMAPHVSGVKGAMGAIAQAAVNMVAKGANQLVSSSTGATSAGSTAGLSGSLVQIVKQLAGRMGWSGQTQDWLNVINRESSGSMTARNASSGAYGIAQFINGPSEYATYGGNVNTMSGQLLAMANYIKQRYTDPAAAWAHELSAGWYAGGGFLGRHLRRMGMRSVRRKVLGFADGGRAPWGGEPVPIVAHEGERIANPNQWGEVARLAGTTPAGLDAHLGYNTGRPRQYFAGGGSVTAGYGSYSPFNQPVLSGSSLSSFVSGQSDFLTSLSTNLFKMDPGSIGGALGVVTKVFNGVLHGFQAIGRLGGSDTSSRVNQITNIVNALENQTDGALLQLANAFQRLQNNLANWVTSTLYGLSSVTLGSVARISNRGGVLSVRGSGFGGVGMRGRLGRKDIGHTGTTALDLLNLRSDVEQGDFISTEESSVATATNRVRALIKSVQQAQHAGRISKSTAKTAIDKLESTYTGLIQQQETLASAMNQNVVNRFQAEQQYIQDSLNQVADVFQTQQAKLQSEQSIDQSLGRLGRLPRIDRALAKSATRQISALMPILREAQRTGDQDLVAQIKQQISQLHTTVAQATAQMIQDAMSAVQQRASVTGARVSMLQAISQTLMSSASTPGGFAAAGRLNARALELNESSLRSQVRSYNNLLGQAIKEGNKGAIANLTQTIDGLTSQLVQNGQAIKDNTAQMVSQATQFIQSRGQFQTGIFGGLGQIISTIGQTTGFTDVAALRGVTRASNTALTGTQTGLLGELSKLGGGASSLSRLLSGAGTPAEFVKLLSGTNLSQIESHQSQQWISTFEGLINNLSQNTEAIAQNNQQLAQLNGQLLQPQSWSTTSWTAFRNAIFSGMGNLLPGFQASLPPGAVPTIAPTFSPRAVAGGTHVTYGDINVTTPTEVLDPQVLGQQLAFETANAL